MSDNPLFVAALTQLAQRNLTVMEVLHTAEQLKAAGEARLAEQLYLRWMVRNPTDPVAFAMQFNYAALLMDRGDNVGAKDALERSLQLKPDFHASSINLATVLERLGAKDKAVQLWISVANQLSAITGQAVTHKITALTQAARVLQDAGAGADSEGILKQILEIDPSARGVIEQFILTRLQQCKWPVIAGTGVPREPLMRKFGPLSMSIYTDDPLLQLGNAWHYHKVAVQHLARYPGVKPRPVNVDRLRIGYLSSDLHGHAIGMLMAEFFELHDRSKVEVFAYYCGVLGEDRVKQRIRAAVEHWVDISKLDEEAATKQIADDGIDILVDINGYTKDARLKVIARRPAPIVVNWLGYPATMGSPLHHYIIADDWIIPKEHEIFFTEKVLRLPCYQPNDRKRMVSQKPQLRAEHKLPEGAFVFCCFNGTQKISRFTFDRWMKILSRVPNSVLWLLDSGEGTRRRLIEEATQRGILPDRLIFAPKMAHTDHLARYPLADLFIDTTPYGAHTTASDALWMGVPVLTLSGHSFASRVCGSLARSAGLPELVCSTPEEFVERAVSLAQDKAELQRYRKRLAANRDTCVLFDTTSLVRHLEELYRQMWKDLHSGQLPRPDLTNLDVYQEVGMEEDHDTVEVLAIKDYKGWFLERMARRHERYPINEDRRLWTADAIARAEAALQPAKGAPAPAKAAAPTKARASKPKTRAKR